MNFERYHGLKKEYPGTVLLFRVGDFHELYFEDAEQASKVLGLTLTTRGKNTESRVAMAGFPYHQLDAYLQKLVKAGFRVSIIDGEPAPEKPKTKKGKWKPNSATRLFISSDSGEDFDICLGETVPGCSCILITPDEDNPKLFQLTHRGTGYAMLRTGLDYVETKRRGEEFWKRLPDNLRRLYEKSEDPNRIFEATPATLRNAIRSGNFE
jgi:hypothetical protein